MTTDALARNLTTSVVVHSNEFYDVVVCMGELVEEYDYAVVNKTTHNIGGDNVRVIEATTPILPKAIWLADQYATALAAPKEDNPWVSVVLSGGDR